MVDSYQKDHNELLVLQQQMCVFEERKCNIHGLIYLDKQGMDVLFFSLYCELPVVNVFQ